MTYQDRDPRSGRDALSVEPEERVQPSQRATTQQALWSWAVAGAVVFILSIVFYKIDAVDHPQTAPTTTASSSSQAAPQTTGQGQSRNVTNSGSDDTR